MPHPIMVTAMAESSSRLNSVCHLRLRSGRPNIKNATSVPPPPKVMSPLKGLCSAAVEAAVVVILSVEVTAFDPEIAAG